LAQEPSTRIESVLAGQSDVTDVDYDLDHAALFSPDPVATARAYERLGFRESLIRGRRLAAADYVHALGSLATIFVLIRLISIPDEFLPASGRGIGIFISLLAALGVVLGGLLRAAEEL